MIRIGSVSSLVAIAILMTGTAHAQEPGNVGIAMAYPAAVGIIWRASDAIAIRPMLTFTGSGSNSTTTTSGNHIGFVFYP